MLDLPDINGIRQFLPDVHMPQTWTDNAKVGGITIPNPLNPIPRTWTNLNRILEITTAPCGDKLAMMVTTLPIALGHALMLWIVPEPSQILQNYLRPSGRRGIGKGYIKAPRKAIADRLGNLRYATKDGIPDIDHEIAQFIPGRGFFGSRVAGTAERWLWTGIDLLDFVGLAWLITDTAADFTHYWISGMIESRFATQDCNAALQRTANSNWQSVFSAPFANGQVHTDTKNDGWSGALDTSLTFQGGATSGVISVEIPINSVGATPANPTDYVVTIYQGLSQATRTELAHATATFESTTTKTISCGASYQHQQRLWVQISTPRGNGFTYINGAHCVIQAMKD